MTYRKIWSMKLLVLPTCFLLPAAGRAVGSSSDVTTITNYLANTYSEIRGTSNAHVRVLTADEAVASVDKVFAKSPMHKFAPDQLARMKRLIKENLAFVYSHDATVVEEPLAYRVNGKDAKLPVGSTFLAYAYRERLFEGDLDPIDYSFWSTASIYPRICGGCVAWVSNGDVFNLQFVANNEIGVLPFPIRRLETSVVTDEKVKENVDVVLVADVADVSFNSLENLNHTCVTGVKNGYSPAIPAATYRVELLVRKVEEGAFDFDRLAFVVDPRKHKSTLCDYFSGWPFFRGVTVKAVLCRVDGKLCVSRIRLALPYPPYAADDILAGYDGNLPSRSRFSLNPMAMARPQGAVAVAYIPYGNHTLTKFYSTTNDIAGSFGRFPDYSRSVRVEVWTASEGADADYWKTAWFSERRRSSRGVCERVPVVTVRNVEEGMDAETRLDFTWHDLMLAPNKLLSVKTLGAFADLVNRHTVCKTCKKSHYRVVLPETLRSRAVRFEKNACGYVLDLLKSVCERTGCIYELKGTALVLRSELSDAELSDISLKGRLKILEKDGFASVEGADYVGFAFWNNGSGPERPHDTPPVFLFRSAYVTTGNGWRRKTADGKFQYLMFDAVWWDMDADKGHRASFDQGETKPRLARDVAKVRAYLREAAERPDEIEFRCDAVKKDSFALAFALHLCQLGRTEDAQSIYDALCLRPAAAEAAFAKLRQCVKVGKRQYSTLEVWQKSTAAGKEK